MDDIKKRILDYSIDTIQNKGIKALTLKNISKDCHISRSTFYQYFESKSSLIEEIKNQNTECDVRSIRESILHAAIETFSNSPYTDIDIETIAKAVNMQRSSIYRYFPTKEKLFEESLKMELESRKDFFQNKDIYSTNFKEALRLFFSYIADFRINPYKNMTFFHALTYSQHNTEVKHALETLWNDTEKMIQKVLQHGKDTGELKQDFSTKEYSKIILSFLGGSSIFISDGLQSSTEAFIDLLYGQLKTVD